MSATKNAHDWYCEEHGIYGWRGESCRQCPETPSEIESLRAQIAELKAENERLTQWNVTAFAQSETHKAGMYKAGNERDELKRQKKVLRDALNLWKAASDNAEESELDDMACYCIPMPLFCDACEATEQALSTPLDTSALEAIVQKAGEVMRERCARTLDNQYCCAYWGEHRVPGRLFSDEVRALPGVTLEDLK